MIRLILVHIGINNLFNAGRGFVFGEWSLFSTSMRLCHQFCRHYHEACCICSNLSSSCWMRKLLPTEAMAIKGSRQLGIRIAGYRIYKAWLTVWLTSSSGYSLTIILNESQMLFVIRIPELHVKCCCSLTTIQNGRNNWIKWYRGNQNSNFFLFWGNLRGNPCKPP